MVLRDMEGVVCGVRDMEGVVCGVRDMEGVVWCEGYGGSSVWWC